MGRVQLAFCRLTYVCLNTRTYIPISWHLFQGFLCACVCVCVFGCVCGGIDRHVRAVPTYSSSSLNYVQFITINIYIIQNRYDFDVEGNGTFRLFPCGTNSYARGAEVLNSYGRRPNDNLLLDYGFAMLDNEWDTAEVACSLPRSDQLLDKRREAYFRSSGQHTVRWALPAAQPL